MTSLKLDNAFLVDCHMVMVQLIIYFSVTNANKF